MIECRSISKTLSARSYTTVLPAVARRSPATRTPPENLKARIVVASVGCHDFWYGIPPFSAGLTIAGASSPLRRSSAGNSSAAPEKFWSNATGDGSIIGRCAGDSAWIDWDRPCASSLKDPSCPAARRQASVGRRRHLVLDPREPALPAFECVQA